MYVLTFSYLGKTKEMFGGTILPPTLKKIRH